MRPSLATRLKTNNAGEQNARSKPTEGLKQACDAAYEANKNSCSHAVISVIRSVYDANILTATEFIVRTGVDVMNLHSSQHWEN